MDNVIINYDDTHSDQKQEHAQLEWIKLVDELIF